MKLKFFSKVLPIIACTLCFMPITRADDGNSDEVNVPIIITIDGGSATKKSPISQAIAERFNLVYFETGALYRTVVDALIRADIEPSADDEERVAEFLDNSKFEMYLEGRTVRFAINDVYLTPHDLRSKEINSKVAEYSSSLKSISDFCISRAREIADLREFSAFDGIIAEGRTCGVYVYPDADLKFWFYATDDAKLDFRLNVEKESDDPLRRDRLDFAREFYPMVCPENAILVWTSSRSIEDNINLVSAFVEQKIDQKKHSK